LSSAIKLQTNLGDFEGFNVCINSTALNLDLTAHCNAVKELSRVL